MSPRSHFIVLAFVCVLVLVVSAFHPLTARADEGNPPSPDNTSEPLVEPDSADASAAADATDTTEPAAPADPTEEPAVVDEVPEAPPPDESQPSLPDVLDQAPEGTEVVVLDSEGSAVPLVTEQAAEILTTADPIWCPTGALPGDAGCTPPGRTTVTELIADLGSKSGDGTIYFTPTYATNDVVLNHTSMDSLGALTIQGGWNGSLGASFGLSGDTTFSVPMTINWDNDVTLNNLVFNDVSNMPASLMVDTTGNIVLNNVTVQGNEDGSGAILDNEGPGASVRVNHSRFNNNDADGLRVYSSGDIDLLDVFASGNDGHGARLDNGSDGELLVLVGCLGGPGLGCEDAPAITVTSSIFNSNEVGLEAYSFGDITLQQVTASENDQQGAYLANTNDFGYYEEIPIAFICNLIPGICAQAFEIPQISVASSTFTENGDGLMIVPAYIEDFWSPFDIFFAWPVDVSLSGVNASYNYDAGGLIATGGNTSVVGSHFDYNTLGDFFEFAIDGGPGFFGLGLSGLGAGIGSVGPLSIDSSTFNWNDDTGLDAWSLVSASLSNVDASQNGSLGALLLAGFPGEEFGGLPFFFEEIPGFEAPLWGNVFIENSTFNSNGFRQPELRTGLEVGSFGGDITINCSHFDNNFDYGVSAMLYPGRTLTTNGSTFANNTAGDVDVEGGAWVDNPAFDCGGSGGRAPLLAWNTIHVAAGQSYDLDCEQYAGTILILPNGDRVVLPCPIGDNASLVSLTTDQLPGELGEQYDFLSAFRVVVTPALSHTMNVGFVLPAGQTNGKFTILHWDGSKWEEVGGSQAGGLFFTNTTLTGEFILVSL